MAVHILTTRARTLGAVAKQGTLTNTGAVATLTCDGEYRLSGSVAFYARGPEAAATPATSADAWYPAGDSVYFLGRTGEHVSAVRQGASSGIYTITLHQKHA